ncbi:MAG: cyclic nucleotide-binding domain-containing protein [Polyangiales bacterium]
MSFDAYAGTDVGLERDHNEDYVLRDDELGLFIVCDGMGGHACGEVASRLTAECIKRVVSSQSAMVHALSEGVAPPNALAELLRHAIETASREVYQASVADPAKRGMGTTCTVLLLVGRYGVMGHVGDSQLHLLRDDTALMLSHDHTFTAEAVRRGAMTEKQAAESEHGNVLMRCVGARDTVQVDTLVFDVVPGDLLLLCSDGLSQYVEGSSELLRLHGGRSPKDFTRTLITAANARGGSDNISVICVLAKPPPDPQNAPTRQDVLLTLDTLKGIQLMDGLAPQEVMLLRQVFREQLYAAGALITVEGEVGSEMYVLLDGAAEVRRGTECVATLGRGAHFGEMALLNDRPRAASVVASTPCRTLVCHRTALYALLQEQPTLASRFYQSLASALSMRLDAIYSFYDTGERQRSVDMGSGRTTLFHGT